MPDKPQTNILIIDNDDGVVQAVSARLTSLGYRCTTANTGAQGLSEFSLGGINLIITDLNMPCLDGLELVDRIRQNFDIPIIIITGFRKEYAKRLGNHRDISILQKPFDSDQLVDLVTAELTLSRGRRAG